MARELITLGGITGFFKDDLYSISKGELKFKGDFVLELRIVNHSVHAKVRASMKDKSYSVTLVVDVEGGISEGKCECPRGNWLCSHMAATAIYANKKGLSKTDLPNSWIARPKKAAKLGPGRKLGDLGDVGDLGELSPSYSSPSFRVGPICITRKLGDIWKSFRNVSKLSLPHFLSIYSLTACKRISFVL